MLVVGNGRLITRDPSNAFTENGAVAINGSIIEAVGTTEDIRKAYPKAEYINAHGGVIMPAFINAHEHIYSAFARGSSDLHNTYLCPDAVYLICQSLRCIRLVLHQGV